MAVDALIADPALVQVLRSAAQVRDQCLQILRQLQAHCDAVAEANESGPTPTQDSGELWQAQLQLNARLAELRGLNRQAVMGVRATKQETADARHEIDSLHLQLQNLYYEQRHLRGEIAACENYSHKYLELPMIPIEEFAAAHPEYEHTSDQDITVLRIQDEHNARQTLEDQRQLLMKQRDALLKETGAQKEELALLDAQVEKWLNGQEGVRKLFETYEQKNSDPRPEQPT